MLIKTTLATVLVLGAAASAAHAEEASTNPLVKEVVTEKIMICDTQKQVERFVTFSYITGKVSSAIKAVNTEAEDPTACGMADAAYLRGAPVGITRTATESFQIVPILVVAIRTPEGMRPAAPALFFTLVKVKEVAV
jgi:hypothetical protein